MDLEKFKKIVGIISAIILLSFFLFFIFLIVEGQIINKDIRLNGKSSIGRFISHEKIKNGYNNYFIYDINGVKFKGIAGWNGSEDLDSNIGKFYRIRYSKKFKGSFNADFNQEVTDTTDIMNAGFTLNQILGNDTIKPKERSFKEEVFIIIGITSNH
jgi:hypothetical protein